ncbi:MAG: hypothetical protein AAB300_00750 [Nitrospirota bacterium]
MEKQIISKRRVADHGEVLTGKREVNAMLDLVKQENERIESRFLEEDKMKTLIITLLAIMLGGCETTNSFVVMRDVPTKPSFTVIPYNNYHYQGVFASKVEEALITLGLKTISPPTVKEVTKTSGLNVQEDGVVQNEVAKKMTALLSGKSAQAISIEVRDLPKLPEPNRKSNLK